MKPSHCALVLPFFLVLQLATPVLADQAPVSAGLLEATNGLTPNLEGRMDKALRYHAEGSDFVIHNGVEYFNRPLYGGNTAFRVDGGDKPEFSLYLPGRGGNLRLGLKTTGGTIWLNEAASITSRYRPGELLYTLSDPLLGDKGRIELEVLAYHQTDGLIVRAQAFDLAKGAELLVAFGGGNGQRGARDGDIGTESVPISQYFQFRPEFAAKDRYQTTANGFVVDGATAQITAVISEPATVSLADAEGWAQPEALLASSADAALKVAVGRVPLNRKPVLISLQVTRNTGGTEPETYRNVTTRAEDETEDVKALSLLPAFSAAELPQQLEATRAHFDAIRNRVQIDTPDPYLNVAMGALNIAADALWDEPQGAIMHGAIAWRAKLLGWRGPYALDALGWHDRARRNLDLWTANQNTDPIPDHLPPADEENALSRSEAALHSNGDLSNSHYDMNVGFFDAMFRHILWTGDLDYARRVWPVIERHLAWEQRMFRREIGPYKLPLYEAYASIWASDSVQYNGGGVAYQSAYNVYHNRMAARIATLIGKDPAPYLKEADLIERGMRAHLWMPEQGAFAEYKDIIGDQLVHPSYGLWSYYHTVDSGVPTPFEAARMSADLTHHLKPIPVKGPDVPADRPYYMLPTTNWSLYSWSTNNVVLSENLHTALGLWLSGSPEEAYTMTRATLLASLYMGISPGNIGTLNYLDVYRRESQRDFADGAGVMSRTIVEGLFGVRPDALSHTLTLSPGFPPEWNHAKLTHPNVGVDFRRNGTTDTWTVTQPDNLFNTLVLELPAHSDKLSKVTVDGKAVSWTPVQAVGAPKVRIEIPLRAQAVIRLNWAGAAIDATRATQKPAEDANFTLYQQGAFGWFALNPQPAATHPACDLVTPQWASGSHTTESVDLSGRFNDRVTEIFKPGKYRSPRSPYVSLALPAHGLGSWAGGINDSARIDDSALRKAGQVSLPGGVTFTTPSGDGPNILFTSHWDNYPQAATIPLSGTGKRLYLLMAGSTNTMQSDLINGEVVVTYSDGTRERLELRNPENWWPIERDMFVDDYQFQVCGKAPVRVDLKTGKAWVPGPATKGQKDRNRKIDGGAANVLDIALDPAKTLQSVTVRSIANEVVIGVMGLSIER